VGFNTLTLPLSLRSNVPAFLGRGEIDERSREADREWPIYDHDIICQRYNRIAAFIPFFEYAFFMPSGLRKRAVDQLKLRQGDRVLEVRCAPAVYPCSPPVLGYKFQNGTTMIRRLRRHFRCLVFLSGI
jgi:hypothetical protein